MSAKLLQGDSIVRLRWTIDLLEGNNFKEGEEMAGRKRRTLWEYLDTVPDHRKPKGVRFKLRSVLALAFAAVLAGRKNLKAIARWAAKLEEEKYKHLLRKFDIDRDNVPCHGTFHYVFKGLKVRGLEQALSSWVRRLAREEVIDHVPIDGKVLRGSRLRGYDGVHLLAAYCEKLKGVLAQVEVPKDGNEITAAMKLLKEIPLEGTIVTGDAIFCQRRICEEVLGGGGDYFVTVKENQPALWAEVDAAFEAAFSPLRAEAATA